MADAVPPSDRELEELKLARVNAKLWALGAKLEAQEKIQQSLSAQLGSLRADGENQKAAQQSMESRLRAQGEMIEENARGIAAIVQSRIWRTLSALGGLVLPSSRSASLQDSSQNEAALPGTLPCPAARKETSTEHAGEGGKHEWSVKEWREELRQAVQSINSPRPAPIVSIITPTFNSKTRWFAEAALSVFRQTFRDWEWCIVDDGSDDTEFQQLFSEFEQKRRIKISRLGQRQGISAALNHGLEIASGEFVCFLDHDDVLAPEALECCRAPLTASFDAVYTDEDKISESGIRHTPLPKPDWSPEFFRWVMYVGHLLCVRRDLALEIGGFRSEYDRVQDYEFMLRYSERTQRIAHVSKILYHWRAGEGSVAADQDAKGDLAPIQIAAVQAHLDRLGLGANALPGPRAHMLRLSPKARVNPARLSIVLTTDGGLETLADCIVSIFSETTYTCFEVICMAGGTSSKTAMRLVREFPIKVVACSCQYNAASANNLGAQRASGGVVAFIGNEVRVLNPDWIEQMLYYAEQDDVGCVGGLLAGAGETAEQAGLMITQSGGDEQRWRFATGEPDGYWGSAVCAHEVTAVSSSCAMLRRQVFVDSGGFDTAFLTDCRDVDLCLRLRSQQKRVIFTPNAGFLDAGPRRADPQSPADDTLLFERWGSVLRAGDPYYKRNATRPGPKVGIGLAAESRLT